MVEVRGRLYISRWYRDDGIASLDAFCPACDMTHGFRVNLGDSVMVHENPWDFNGDYDRPTFSPSMFANRDFWATPHHPSCHSYLENGIWRYLPDCSHQYAGQELALPYPDPDMSFERRHGWHLYPWTDENGKPLRDDNGRPVGL